MKSSILRAGVVTLACALGLSACGGGDGDLYLYGSVSGVTKDGLVLKNGGNTVAVTAPYTSFQFEQRVSTDDAFDITYSALPSNVKTCVVNNGKARANYYTIAQITVVCEIKKHEFSVAVRGLTGTGLVIVNGSDRRDVAPGATSVAMTPVYEDGPYGVTVLTQPAGQVCSVTGGTNGKGAGTMGATDLVDNVVVTCV
ncbi:hypothetical protein [uncultured Massilia sp.]|uniref:hypothetical protein n=1 Tax=uncultured Massilia sp. TaxID=169973 RepID=UPI0025E2658E|nr:hypothetical protein [uncultured Massilia sp.]